MADEEVLCVKMKQSVCDLVNPINPRGRGFGSQHIKDFAMEYAVVGRDKADEEVCGAMSNILEDPGALRV